METLIFAENVIKYQVSPNSITFENFKIYLENGEIFLVGKIPITKKKMNPTSQITYKTHYLFGDLYCYEYEDQLYNPVVSNNIYETERMFMINDKVYGLLYDKFGTKEVYHEGFLVSAVDPILYDLYSILKYLEHDFAKELNGKKLLKIKDNFWKLV